ncbi:uncharacterized protein LOC100180660 [Ciona intestinalis]
METNLDLYNFETSDAEGSRYVLTSPRSLDACSRLNIRPIQLLQKTHADFAEENAGKSSEFIKILYNDWEEKRIAKLNRCRKVRETIIMEQKVLRKKQTTERQRQKSKTDTNKTVMDSKKKREKESNPILPSPSTSRPKHIRTPKVRDIPDKKTTSTYHAETTAPVIATHSPSPTPADDTMLHASALQTLEDPATPRSERPSRLNAINLSNRSRSRSVDGHNRPSRSERSSFSLRSSSVFGNSSKLASGYITPQIQRDKRLVEVMKDRRRREEGEEKQRLAKWMEWNNQMKKTTEIKRKEELQRQKELATSHQRWEKKIQEELSKKRKEAQMLEQDLMKQQKQTESILKMNKEKQEKMRLQQIEDRKIAALERKQQQEKSLNCVNQEIMAFQEATDHDIRDRLTRAEKVKLENEMKELEKIKLMNKRQRERFHVIQGQLRRKNQHEEEIKRDTLNQKLSTAEQNHHKKVMERENTVKMHGKEMMQKIQQTRENQKKLDKEMEEHLNDIAQHKKQLLLRATNTALKNTMNKSVRAQAMREESEKGWRRKLTEVQERDQQVMQRTKEDLEAKENRVKTHLQLKEAAFEFSRFQAKINEAEREIVKRKSSNFSQMAQQAQLNANIGKGPRSSFVNYSTVKLG